MDKACVITGFPSLRQPNTILADHKGSCTLRCQNAMKVGDSRFTGKRGRKVRGFVVKNLNKYIGKNDGSGLRYTRDAKLRIGRCSLEPDVAGDAVSNSRDQSDVSHNGIFNQADLQSGTGSGSCCSLKKSLVLETEGMVFGLGEPDSWDSMEIGCPVVRRYLSDNEERWYMWYYGRKRGSQDSVGLALSANGVHWLRGSGIIDTDEDVGIVMECTNDWWAFDTEIIRPSDVLVMSSAKARISSGVYWLYYSGCNSDEIKIPRMLLRNPGRFGENGVESIVFRSLPGLAMSPDGRNWARIEGDHHSGALLDIGAEGEWDSLSVAAPQVVVHSLDDLRMYYHSFDVKSGCFSVGIARSRDGIRWVKLGKILDGGLPGSFDELGITNRHVISNQKGNGYLMVYEGVAANGSRSIGLAQSHDGLKNWKRSQNKPVFGPAPTLNAWDSRGVGSPCLVHMDGNEWRLYYQGVGIGGKTGIGLATCIDGSLKNFQRWHGFHV